MSSLLAGAWWIHLLEIFLNGNEEWDPETFIYDYLKAREKVTYGFILET